MTDEEKRLRHLLGYISLVRDELRMSHWDIILHREPGDDDTIHAETWQPDNHFTINIRLGPDFFDQNPAQIRNTIAHELTHAQHRDLNILWVGCTQNNDDVPLSQARSWDGDYQIQIERFVSWTTRLIAPTLSPFDHDAPYAVGRGCYMLGEQVD